MGGAAERDQLGVMRLLVRRETVDALGLWP
jgi:hypothetical protein